MATTIRKYLDKCYEVYAAKPVYERGASSLDECDCIGMPKYSFRENEVHFSTSGTNYSCRKQVDNLRKIESAADLKVGDVVFKAYEPWESGWALPEKYQEGGYEYNGDLRDYYHIGVVYSKSPLQIIHMTSPTSQMDTTLKNKGWDFVGNWKKEYIDGEGGEPTPEPDPEPEPDPVMGRVWSKNGKPVNTRRGPDETYSLSKAGKIPVGEVVEILETVVNEQFESWCRIRWVNKEEVIWFCWMKAEYIVPVDQPIPDTVFYTVHIPNLTIDQAQALVDFYPGAWKTEKE